MRIFRGELTLLEDTFFASREIGILYETEPLIGNYALAYAIGLCQAPYRWDGGPRYKEDLGPVNERGVYVTPATFTAARFAVSQFNAQTDSYYSRFDQNAIATTRATARPANFPQAGRIRMLAAESRAFLHLLARDEVPRLPSYVRLGKFNSKARIDWAEQRAEERQAVDVQVPFLLNGVDLPDTRSLRQFVAINVPPAPLIRDATLSGPFWVLADGTHLPAGMRFGVDSL